MPENEIIEYAMETICKPENEMALLYRECNESIINQCNASIILDKYFSENFEMLWTYNTVGTSRSNTPPCTLGVTTVIDIGSKTASITSRMAQFSYD